MAKLLSPYKIAGIELKNRIVMPPMCTYAAEDESGCPNLFHFTHYGARALGGVGLIIVEATGVEPKGRISDRDLGLWSDAQIAAHQKLTETIKAFGAKAAVQLGHAGRKSVCAASVPIAPSALPFSPQSAHPHALETEEIETIKKAFVDAALRAKTAGYDLIELHSAHGYLLTEFLSPLTNTRNDRYGGTLENRCRLSVEIAGQIKQATGLPLIVRISAEEWVEGGWIMEDSIYLAAGLKAAGADMIHVSAGGNHPDQPLMPPVKPLYQSGYAKTLRQKADVPVIAVGLITTAEEGETLLQNDACDLVAYGRELLRSPNFPFFAAKALGRQEVIHPAYLRAF